MAGVDEVGRGALAGPVVAAAVVLEPWDDADDARTESTCGALSRAAVAAARDSKQLSPAARARLAPALQAAAVDWALGWACPREIDALGIAAATRLAMRRALVRLEAPPDGVLVDGRPLPPLGPWRQQAIVRGDAAVRSIAAASILAKVGRDAWMIRLDEACPGYGFAAHKGYGAPAHRDAIARLGPTVHHRLTWRLGDDDDGAGDAGARSAAQAGRGGRGAGRRAAGGARVDDSGAQLALPRGRA